jgi:hypothetical protein
MVAETLREGFAVAHRRPGLIIFDVIWKLVWLTLTLLAMFIVFYQFVSNFSWNTTGVQALDAVSLANAINSLWRDYGGEFLGALIAVMGISSLIYLVLEANIRRRFVLTRFRPAASREQNPQRTSLLLFLGSTLSKVTILGSLFVILQLMAGASRSASIAAVIAFAAVAFFLTIIETLVRNDAVELLGTDLFGVTGVIGTLVGFELLINASLLVVLVACFINASNGNGALAMLAVTGLVLFILIFLHSYLLVVRFSAVGIMRRNVIDV